MANRLMISVAAAALIAGSGLAFAQGAGGAGAGGAGPAAGGGGSAPPAQHSAPPSDRGAPSAAPMNRDSAAPTGPKGAESTDGAKGGMKNAQTKDGMTKDGMARDGAKEGMAKDATPAKDGMTKDTAQTKDGMSKDGTTAAKDGKSTTTTGNAATSATAAPPAEKRTQIVSAIRSEKIQETTNVNFNISVGAMVPASVRFHPLPPRIVEIYPEWRGYDVVLVGGRYIIVRPQTHEIVYIIEG